jgi:hypothetical protein
LGFDVKHQNPTLEAVVQFFKCFLLDLAYWFTNSVSASDLETSFYHVEYHRTPQNTTEHFKFD